MSLNNIKNIQKERGFTIVELLIVIVVIGILAAITIVAYNGVQNRAKFSAAASAAETVQKKAEAFNSIKGNYPTSTADFSSLSESTLAGSNLTILGTPSASNGTTVVTYSTCTGGGYRIQTWDYTANALETATTGTNGGGATPSSTCTAVTS